MAFGGTDRAEPEETASHVRHSRWPSGFEGWGEWNDKRE
jgi:hypothetical protein